MSPLQRNHRRELPGFTLVELLVTIAIVGVLASLVFSGFGKFRERSIAAGCTNNLRQIGMAMIQYAGENNNFFPPTYNEKGPWSTVLVGEGYVEDTRIFKCPGDVLNVAPVGEARSYCYCSIVMMDNYYDRPTTALNRLKIENLSKQYLITEWHNNAPDSTWDGGMALAAGWDIATNPVGRHNSAGRSFLFADGHVEQLPAAKAGDPHRGWILNDYAGYQ